MRLGYGESSEGRAVGPSWGAGPRSSHTCTFTHTLTLSQSKEQVTMETRGSFGGEAP